MSKIKSIEEAMQDMVEKKKTLKNGLQTARVEAIWQEVMGQAARYAEKVQMINRTLFITSSNGAFKNEIFFQRKLILERMNEAFGDAIIDKIVIN